MLLGTALLPWPRVLLLGGGVISLHVVVSDLPTAPIATQDVRKGGWKKLWIVFGVLFVIALVIFYLGMCLYRRDISIVDDLRKLSNSKRKKRMELLKSKNY